MRAILLAAGMGTRLRPLTLDTPKSLIKINGKPLLERQIEFLKEIGISDIIVVTGYLNEKFNYLRDKYGIKLINNDKYNEYNNIYTMYLVREFLSDTYVIDADVYINNNFLKSTINSSTYFTAYKKNVKGEWQLHFDDDKNVFDIDIIDGEGYILTGVSYWNVEDSKIIVKELERTIEAGKFTNLYWDDIVKENLSRLNVKVDIIDENDIFEIDNLEELEMVKNKVEF